MPQRLSGFIPALRIAINSRMDVAVRRTYTTLQTTTRDIINLNRLAGPMPTFYQYRPKTPPDPYVVPYRRPMLLMVPPQPQYQYWDNTVFPSFPQIVTIASPCGVSRGAVSSAE